ncbi:MAG: hypothetical protein JEZ06_19695 [Anaerolineaceae bacterium]|nr:hypothetical protein [Anaerolineaceae bacterium]
MLKNMASKNVDLIMVIIANIINFIMVTIFISRPQGWERLETIVGLILISLIIPLSFIAIRNFQQRRDWWTFTLPMIMILFLILELLLDYILQLDFRQSWILGPYLLMYYLSEMMMIGYAFLCGKPQGAITLITYFMQLAASYYSYKMVGY